MQERTVKRAVPLRSRTKTNKRFPHITHDTFPAGTLLFREYRSAEQNSAFTCTPSEHNFHEILHGSRYFFLRHQHSAHCDPRQILASDKPPSSLASPATMPPKKEVEGLSHTLVGFDVLETKILAASAVASLGNGKVSISFLFSICHQESIHCTG